MYRILKIKILLENITNYTPTIQIDKNTPTIKIIIIIEKY